MAVEAHYGLVDSKSRTAIPLKGVSVEAEICGYVLGLKSTLKYHNSSNDPLEVVFRLPLEQSHAVVGLTALIGGHKVRAELKEKQEAKLMYDDAIASGQTAALAEEKAGDIFSMSLGNFPSLTEAEIVLEIVGELPIDAEGEVRFSLPNTLKPRYVPAGSFDPLAPVGGAGTDVKRANVSTMQEFSLSILNQEVVDTVASPTHSIEVRREDRAGTKVDVALSDCSSESLAKDLVILIKHKQPHVPKALVELGMEDGSDFMKHAAVMINFFPEFPTTMPQSCREFIFLIDRSGSMCGSDIESAKQTLLLFLKSLPKDCRFNILGFGSTYVKLFKEASVKYSQESLDKALLHVQQIAANMGGTELLPPLKDVLSVKPPGGIPREVFVLTDGSVSNTHSCIDIVKRNASTSRCFTFGIGSGASTVLVEGLAKAGNGCAEFVKPGERMQPKVIRSLKRALQPSITDIKVEFDLSEASTTYQCPDQLAPAFAGDKLVVYGLVDTPQHDGGHVEGTATLNLEISGMTVTQQYKVPFGSDRCSTNMSSIFPVHRLAAKALISDWQSAGKLKGDIISLSVDSSVISSHTAFIAVDEDSKPVSGAMKVWDLQPNPLHPFSPQYNICANSSPLPAQAQYGAGMRPMMKSAFLGAPPSGAMMGGSSIGQPQQYSLSANSGPPPAAYGPVSYSSTQAPAMLSMNRSSEFQSHSSPAAGGSMQAAPSPIIRSAADARGSPFIQYMPARQVQMLGRPPTTQPTLITQQLVERSPPLTQPAMDMEQDSPTKQFSASHLIERGPPLTQPTMLTQQLVERGPPLTQQVMQPAFMQSTMPTYHSQMGYMGPLNTSPPALVSRDVSEYKGMMPSSHSPSCQTSYQQRGSSVLSPEHVLSILIAAQQADGSWKISSILSQILSRSEDEIRQSIPVGLKKSPVADTVWATILALTILEEKCKGQRDEWELIAAKGNRWLKDHVLSDKKELRAYFDSALQIIA